MNVNNLIAIAAAFGVVVGMVVGILSNNFEESKRIRRIEEKNYKNSLELRRLFAKKEELYQQEINRLNEVIAQSARSRVVEHPEAAKMTDFVEISLERGGYKEIDLSGRAKR